MWHRTLTALALLAALAAPAHGSAKKEAAPPTDGVQYFALAPALISNVQSQGKPRFLRCEVQFQSGKPDAVARLTLHGPALRHALLMLFVEQDSAVLQTPAGRDQLRKAALESARGVMQAQTGEPWIDDLYFTSFYVQ
ncbi:MAG: flagellar basal body-associated FliL family protein [Gammaproteobacteria bacterium]|jgi:flagellar FliL protein|nr:flagellar basal body-associated FliL family protein [Gammaproteobacteria bacterium]